MKQQNAYSDPMNHYADAITGRKWRPHIHAHWLWGIDENKIARQLTGMIPQDSHGKPPDAPVGTAVFRVDKYAESKETGKIKDIKPHCQ